jgi:hypothetical protein
MENLVQVATNLCLFQKKEKKKSKARNLQKLTTMYLSLFTIGFSWDRSQNREKTNQKRKSKILKCVSLFAPTHQLVSYSRGEARRCTVG